MGAPSCVWLTYFRTQFLWHKSIAVVHGYAFRLLAGPLHLSCLLTGAYLKNPSFKPTDVYLLEGPELEAARREQQLQPPERRQRSKRAEPRRHVREAQVLRVAHVAW